MISGRLNKHIIIEHTVTTRDLSTGEELASRKEMIPVRADVQWGNGARRNINDEIVPYYAVTFITWDYLARKISEGDKINYSGKKYVVDSLEPMPEQRLLYIKCLTS